MLVGKENPSETIVSNERVHTCVGFPLACAALIGCALEHRLRKIHSVSKTKAETFMAELAGSVLSAYAFSSTAEGASNCRGKAHSETDEQRHFGVYSMYASVISRQQAERRQSYEYIDLSVIIVHSYMLSCDF